MEIITRAATLADIPFLVETIIEAEKSGTPVFSYTTIFGLSLEEAKKYIALMLEEEIDGCELSISAFLVAELQGKLVGAVCAWIEGSEGVSSITLKGNLLRYTLPSKCFESIYHLNPLIKELHIEYVPNTIQVGLVYVAEEARGKGLVQKLLQEKMQQLRQSNKDVNEAYVQVFGHNVAAIKAYEKLGFRVSCSKTANTEEISKYLPSSSKLSMKLNLKSN